MYFPTRYGKEGISLKIYEEGHLVEERHMSMPHAVLPYYLKWWWAWTRELRKFSRRHNGTIALFTQPIVGIGMSFQRNVRHVFWQWDYFPDGVFVSRIFNMVANSVARACWRYRPLTTAICRAMGMGSASPVMLGMTVPQVKVYEGSKRLLMVGQLRRGQGVERVLDFMSQNPQYSLSLLGAASGGFENEIRKTIESFGIGDRVLFPNRFLTDAELRNEAGRCFAAFALYDVDSRNLTKYADPGKVKSSIEMGLPVIMTRISDIVPFVERFCAGEVIDSFEDLSNAINRIIGNYRRYQEGLVAFARHFDCETYYLESGLLCDAPNAEVKR